MPATVNQTKTQPFFLSLNNKKKLTIQLKNTLTYFWVERRMIKCELDFKMPQLSTLSMQKIKRPFTERTQGPQNNPSHFATQCNISRTINYTEDMS